MGRGIIFDIEKIAPEKRQEFVNICRQSDGIIVGSSCDIKLTTFQAKETLNRFAKFFNVDEDDMLYHLEEINSEYPGIIKLR